MKGQRTFVVLVEILLVQGPRGDDSSNDCCILLVLKTFFSTV